MVRLKEKFYNAQKSLSFAFQFHNGPIKRQSRAPKSTERNGFNSTMVRLKATLQICELFNFCSFNSTMVRLKVKNRFPMYWIFYGFNSTMVRLKVKNRFPMYWIFYGFNSTMVRLKVIKYAYQFRASHWFQFHNGPIKST